MSANNGQNNKEMKVKELIELMSFISSSELNEVKIETEEMKLSVRKTVEVETRFVEHYAQAPVSVAPAQVAPVSAAPVQQAANIPAAAPVAAVSSGEDKYITIKSPMIGTFYKSANPESPSFVEIGSKVSKGQTVCIIEAMKLFNEIESEVSGTIVKILVDNSSPVEFDQPLFLVDPS
jgi:acetyl-CoA carboxylase biotin carboxyl carrier protein